MRITHLALWTVLFSVVSGCQPKQPAANDSSPADEVTNRIPIPPEVISNIGISFETAERGRLGRWLRVPGRLEVPQDRRWTVRAPAQGRARPRVRVGDTVEKGAVLVVLESPALLDARKTIFAATNAVRNAEDEARASAARLKEAELLWAQTTEFETKCQQRRNGMRELQGAATDSSSALSSRELIEAEQTWVDARGRTLETAVLRDDLQKRARRLTLEVARAKIEVDQQIASLAVLTGHSVDALSSSVDGTPVWKTLSILELRAPGAGVVMSVDVADGERVSEDMPLVILSDPSMLVFAGYVPESDFGALTPSAPTRVRAAGLGNAHVLTKLWESPPTYDEDSRALRVNAWVPNLNRRVPHGISATAHIQISESAAEEVVIPEACVVFDGLEAVVFRRDPDDPNVAIRTPVELGERASGQVEVLSGVLDGDEVVRNGVHQLKQTGMGKAPEGGHFHADGTWHEED